MSTKRRRKKEEETKIDSSIKNLSQNLILPCNILRSRRRCCRGGIIRWAGVLLITATRTCIILRNTNQRIPTFLFGVVSVGRGHLRLRRWNRRRWVRGGGVMRRGSGPESAVEPIGDAFIHHNWRRDQIGIELDRIIVWGKLELKLEWVKMIYESGIWMIWTPSVYVFDGNCCSTAKWNRCSAHQSPLSIRLCPN